MPNKDAIFYITEKGFYLLLCQLTYEVENLLQKSIYGYPKE